MKTFFVLLLGCFSIFSARAASQPNIVLLYADDLGYGDVGAYGATQIPTPNIDRLAKEGIRFLNGYAAAATCTPSRYSLLTGEYPWRKKGTGILPGDAALIIQPGRTTIASVLKKAGYHTGVIGKWHLGLGKGQQDWNGEIKPGPLEIGFDESFIMAATLDRVPCVFLRNHRVENLDPKDPLYVSYSTPFPGEPTGKANPEMLKMHPSFGHNNTIVNGISRIGFSKGGKSALWKDEEISDTITTEAVRFIEKNQKQPFFLYFAIPEPHVPRVANPRYVGKTGLGPRGDVIVQADDSIGKILETLDRLKLAENTLVILSSDNGPVLDDGYKDQAVEKNKALNHKPAGPFSGGKYMILEGGTRVPFIVRWTGKIKPAVSEALISQVDLVASFAALTNQSFDKATASDSENVLPALMGDSPTGRDSLVIDNGKGRAIRNDSWKYIEPFSGTQARLFDLKTDPSESKILADQMPAKCEELKAQLEQIKELRHPSGSKQSSQSGRPDHQESVRKD